MLGAELGDLVGEVAGVVLRGLGLGGLSGLGARKRADPPAGAMVGRGEAVVVGILVAGLSGRDVGGGRI